MGDKNGTPTVVSEGFIDVGDELRIKVLNLSDGSRVIPEEEMKLVCEFLGVDLSEIKSLAAVL